MRSAKTLGSGSGRRRRPHHPRGAASPARTRRRAIRYSWASEPSGGPVVGRQVGLEGLVGDLVGQVEPVPQGPQLGLGHLLDLVGGVAGLDLGAERPALDRLGQDDRRRPRAARWPACRRRRACGSRGRPGAGPAARRRSGARPACAAAGRGRRSARGCRRPTRWRTSGTRRRRWCSSCRAARRRRRGPAARPSLEPQMTLITFQPAPRKSGLELLDDLAVAPDRARRGAAGCS